MVYLFAFWVNFGVFFSAEILGKINFFKKFLGIYYQSVNQFGYTGLKLRVHTNKIIFSFLNQNICCGYSKEPSQ